MCNTFEWRKCVNMIQVFSVELKNSQCHTTQSVRDYVIIILFSFVQQKIQSVRNAGEAYGRTNLHSKLVTQPSPGVTITPLNNAYNSAKTKNMGSVPTPSASMVHSHTQHLPKYLSSSRFL